MWRRIRRLSKAAGRVPSALFATLYLLAIPAFGFFYTMMPHAFFHTTVQYESVLDSDADELLARLRDEIIAQFKKEHGSESEDIGDWRFHVDGIRLHELRPEGTRLTFTIRTELEGTGDLKGARQYCGALVTFDAKISYAVGFPGDPDRTIFAEPVISPDSFPIPSRVLFPAKIGPGSAETLNPVLAISDSLHKDIVVFLNAVRGFPSAASGSFARMFYFSAVTITTLGYGDIVPITNAARIIVAIESILGIVLLGLFINSVFRERNGDTG